MFGDRSLNRRIDRIGRRDIVPGLSVTCMKLAVNGSVLMDVNERYRLGSIIIYLYCPCIFG